MMAPQSSEALPLGVVHAPTLIDDVRVLDPDVTAVILPADGIPRWQPELDRSIVDRRLTIQRTMLPSVTPEQLGSWAFQAVAGLPQRLATLLVADLVDLADRVSRLGSVERLMARIFTEPPTRRCGFHVDTVPPQAPTVGALRVYNGASTEYVEPADVRDMTVFYGYLSRRERLSRALGRAEQAGDGARAAALLAELVAMDDAPNFLRPGAIVRRVPAGSSVLFKHVDSRAHWSAHPVRHAWVHRSPMTGTPRLVVNLSPAERARPRRRPE